MSNLENVKENKVKLDDIENDRESSQTKYKKTSWKLSQSLNAMSLKLFKIFKSELWTH